MKTHTAATDAIEELKSLWLLLFPGVPSPPDDQWGLWFLRHRAEVVREGITELALKFRKLRGQMDQTYMGKYASSIMNRLTREQ
jgi:hypothetical protein